MANEIRQFLRDHGISEVEAIIPDMAGIARGKIMPSEKFAEEEGMRLPESIFLQTVTGDYPALSRRLRDETGSVRRYVNIYVNGNEIRRLQGLVTAVAPGQEVLIIQSVAGG